MGDGMRYFLALAVSYMVSGNVYAEVSDRVVVAFGLGASYPVAVDGRSPYDPDINVRPGFGGVGTSVSSNKGWQSGVHIGGSLGYLLDKRQKFIVSSSFDYTNYHKNTIEGEIVRTDQSLEVVSIFADLKVRLRTGDGLVLPYIKGGIGLFRSSREDRLRVISEVQNKIGLGLDAGIDLALSERAGFFAEAQYQIGLTDGKKTQQVPFKAGIFLR